MFGLQNRAQILLVLLLESSTCLLAQNAAPYRLVMKSAVPAFQQVDVLYSPDGRFAAVTGNNEIYIYNLRYAQEVYRAHVPNPFLSAHTGAFAFDSTSTHLYLKDQFSLLDCVLGGATTQCRTLREDVGMGFQLAKDGRIVFTNMDNVPTAVDPRDPSKPVLFEKTVPSADESDFTFGLPLVTSAAGRHSQLTLAGSIDRTSRIPGDGGRLKTVTKTEWRASVFDLDSAKTLFRYVMIPLDVSDSALTADGHTILCGQDQTELDKASKSKDPDKLVPNGLYDLNLSRYLTGADLNGVPQTFRKSCLQPDIASVPVSFFSGPTGPARGWKSPTGEFEITVGTSPPQTQVIYLKHLTTPFTTDVLAGAPDLLQHVSFLPPASVVATGLFSTHVFDFASGGFVSAGVDIRYAPGKRNAFYNPDPATKLSTLTFYTSDNQLVATNVKLKKQPSWFGISADGNAVAYEESSGLSLFVNGASTKLQCDKAYATTLDPQRSPVIDPAGSSLGAFCGRDSSEPANSGFDPFFVVWDLATGKERAQVPATEYEQASAIGWDRTRVVLGGRRGLRIATIGQKDVANINLAGLDRMDTVSLIRVHADGLTATLALTGTLSRAGKLLTIDLSTGKPKREITSSESITDFVLDSAGTAIVLRSDNIVSVYGNSGNRLVQLIATGPDDWLAFSEEGLFDGSAGGLEWAGFRLSDNAPLMTANLFFNELYTPGLLARLLSGPPPRLPAGIGLATYLELPGLKLMLQNGDLIPDLRSGKAGVCVTRDALFTTLKARGLKTDSGDTACPRRIVLTDQSSPAALVEGMKALVAKRPTTPWDGMKLNDTGGVVHVLSVAVSRYAPSALPDVPTAVPASRTLAGAIAARAAGAKVQNWNQDKCGALENQTATKSAVLGCLQKMAQEVRPEDMVVLSFAGHGGTTGQSELFYYYVHGSGNAMEGISSAELADAIRKLQAKRIVLVVDACDSGAAVEPLQQAVLARSSVAANMLRQPGTPPDLQGVLLIAAASGLEATVSSSQANPFLDRLAKLVGADSPAPLSSYSLAAEMQKPFDFTTEGGTKIRVQPFTSALGADFQITKASRK